MPLTTSGVKRMIKKTRQAGAAPVCREVNNMGSEWKYKKGNPVYDGYIHSGEWRRKADARLEIDRHKCQVCGGEATDVHHLTYDRFGRENMDDLVSLCRKCHDKAEEFFDPSIIPLAMEERKPEGNNFMAAMRVDAVNLAPAVFEYLKEVYGDDFEGLMRLRQPDDPEGRKYWNVLKRSVDALCRKRYSRCCVEDRTDMILGSITNRTAAICLQVIEHRIRNSIQAGLHEKVMDQYGICGKWKDVAEILGISNGTLQTLRRDDGSSFGPSLRETVLYYCGLDAAAGIQPLEGFWCLTSDDYRVLNTLAGHMAAVSGSGKFKGEMSL